MGLFIGDSRDFYGTLQILPGARLLEGSMYDSAAEEQGLGRVTSVDPKKGEGLWLEGKLVAASDHAGGYFKDRAKTSDVESGYICVLVQ